MNFAGMGAPLMKKVMKQQNAMSLEDLIASAREQDVKLQVACTLSMDILGFKQEEMLDDMEYVGVRQLPGRSRRGQRQPLHLDGRRHRPHRCRRQRGPGRRYAAPAPVTFPALSRPVGQTPGLPVGRLT